ncbi:hypothetical protein AGR56_08990 [Clostridium sp. DMHC 10]|uniref:hypothetical protein n=1 Tax=Clostridium sp. DMHC 10 TaxID=747377 RepID=UPI00069F5C5B|nr:hypothetical protein [Clostridium sp. DMHC 10]KOF56791.1 hypothetical protein AGR56_08990 [Clostridium sp. DMHC 10]
MKNKKEAVHEVQVQELPREEQIKNVENQILSLLDKNKITFLEWQKLLSSLSFDVRKSSVFTIGKMKD